MVTNGAIEPLSEVDRWNRQLADSVSQKLNSNMRIPQSVAQLSSTILCLLAISSLKLYVTSATGIGDKERMEYEFSGPTVPSLRNSSGSGSTHTLSNCCSSQFQASPSNGAPVYRKLEMYRRTASCSTGR
jgi:hypothetical protein